MGLYSQFVRTGAMLAVLFLLSMVGPVLSGPAVTDQLVKEQVDLLAEGGGTAVTMDPGHHLIADVAITIGGDTIIGTAQRDRPRGPWLPSVQSSLREEALLPGLPRLREPKPALP